MIERYDWRGGSEALLCIGADLPVTLIVIPALFSEANKMRRFTVSLMRALATMNIGSILPDLPGTGESLIDLRDVFLDDWLAALDAVGARVGTQPMTIGIRGGCLLDGLAHIGWRLAPEPGDRLLRDLTRATAFTTGQKSSELDKRARSDPTTLAEYDFGPQLYAGLAAATPPSGHYRTARLQDDSGARDASFTGKKLWRTADPDDDQALVEQAAEDIVDWVRRCANC